MIMLNGSRTPVRTTELCTVGTCFLFVLATAVAITPSAMSAVPVIEPTPADLAGFVLVMQTLLRILFRCTAHRALREQWHFRARPGQRSICQTYLPRLCFQCMLCR